MNEQEHAAEMELAYQNAARDALRRGELPATPSVESPFDVRFRPATQPSQTSISDEIAALESCALALQPVSHDKVALRRIYDYLHQLFPACRPTNRSDVQ